jgi:hypothetical protein
VSSASSFASGSAADGSAWHDVGVRTRALTWALTLPLAGAGVLVGHDLTYRLVGRADPALHDYLAHAPQLVAILAMVGLLGLAVDQRAVRVGTTRFAFLGMGVFALQEHVERFVHTGTVPFILTDRTFLLGLLLQIPIGLACVAVAKALARELHAPSARRRYATRGFSLPVVVESSGHVPATVAVILRGRSPPSAFGSTIS